MVYRNILHQFMESLEDIKNSGAIKSQSAKEGLSLCKLTLTKLKSEVEKRGFKSKLEEILFFKEVKKVPLMYHFYFSAVLVAEISMPKSSVENKLDFLNKKLSRIDKRLAKFFHLLQYRCQNESSFDTQYFTRRYQDYRVFKEEQLKEDYKDPIFNTACDSAWAEMHFLELFLDYLRQRILEIKRINVIGESRPFDSLKWTRSKVALVEMIYGIYCSGALNNGNIEIKKIVAQFEKYFNIDLGDYYGSFIQLKSRKFNRTKFLDEIRANLIRKMEEHEA